MTPNRNTVHHWYESFRQLIIFLYHRQATTGNSSITNPPPSVSKVLPPHPTIISHYRFTCWSGQEQGDKAREEKTVHPSIQVELGSSFIRASSNALFLIYNTSLWKKTNRRETLEQNSQSGRRRPECNATDTEPGINCFIARLVVVDPEKPPLITCNDHNRLLWAGTGIWSPSFSPHLSPLRNHSCTFTIHHESPALKTFHCILVPFSFSHPPSSHGSGNHRTNFTRRCAVTIPFRNIHVKSLRVRPPQLDSLSSLRVIS